MSLKNIDTFDRKEMRLLCEHVHVWQQSRRQENAAFPVFCMTLAGLFANSQEQTLREVPAMMARHARHTLLRHIQAARLSPSAASAALAIVRQTSGGTSRITRCSRTRGLRHGMI